MAVKKINKSQEKRHRQSLKRRLRNRSTKTLIKTRVKKVLNDIETKSDSLMADYKEAVKVINKAASKGILHKRTAARKISRLTIKVNKVIQQ